MYSIIADNEKGKGHAIKMLNNILGDDALNIQFYKDCVLITTPDNTYKMQYPEEKCPAKKFIHLDNRKGIKLVNIDNSRRHEKKLKKIKEARDGSKKD